MPTAVSKPDKVAVKKLKDNVHYACQKLGIQDRGSLPIGGKYSHAVYTKPVIIRKHKFTAIVYQPENKYSLGIFVVEELPVTKKNPNLQYRPVHSMCMVFCEGKVESFWEMVDWGYSTDGYGMMLERFEHDIITYLKRFPIECGTIGALPFKNSTEALDYYTAWQTREECESQSELTRKQLREFNKKQKKEK